MAKKLTVTVHTLDAFGQGVARHQGKTIFVKQALPDETVDIRLTEDKEHYAKANVISYHNMSQARVKAECVYYGLCGGCNMQHISLTMQQQVKRDALIRLLYKETGQQLDSNSTDIISAAAYHYRRRARLAVNIINNQLVMGFRQAESKQIVNITICPVLVEELSILLQPLHSCLQGISNKRALGHLELISVTSGRIIILRHTLPLDKKDIELLTQFANHWSLSFYLQGDKLIKIAGKVEHYYCIDELKLMFSPSNFIQVNEKINTKMIATALDWLALAADDRVLDLFCGMGNFSLPIGTKCRKVVGVEGVDQLVEKAKFNAILNKALLSGEVDFFTYNLDDITKQNDWLFDDFNKVLLDPARAGAANAMATIVKIAPVRIVYISCNPATLARDSKMLMDAGYRIIKISILDMFPQTQHIESMLLFMKSGLNDYGSNKRCTSAP